MALVCQVLYKESYSFTDKETGQLVQGGKIQVIDPTCRLNTNGKVGSPAFFLKAEFSVFNQIPDNKLPGRYELQTTRIPRKDKNGQDVMEERVLSAKLIEG